MMVLLMEKIIPVLLLTISFPRIVKSYRGPIMINYGAEQVVNEGETLKLTCAGNKEIFFHYPNNNVSHFLTTTNAVKIDNDTIVTTLTRKNVTVGDTGYFSCSYNNTAIPQNDFNQLEDVSWKYIYVQSHKELFVPVKKFSVFVIEFHKGVIPCRPTSPNYTVILYTENSDLNYTKVELSEKITFDPRIGFEIMNTSTPDAKWYKCEIILPDNKFSQELEFQLILHTQLYTIMETESKYLRSDESFKLDCSFSNLWFYFDYVVEWETPYGNLDCNSLDIFSGVKTSTTDLGNITTCNLSIKDLFLHHAGIYTCVLRSPILGIQRKAMRLYVFNPPVVKLKTSSKYALKGDDFTATCISTFQVRKPSTYSESDEDFLIPQTEIEGSQFFIVSPFGRYTVQLITPNNVLNLSTDDNYSISTFRMDVVYLVKYVFPIKNIDFNDEGNYTCSYQSDDMDLIDRRYIKVHDSKDVHLRLIPKNEYPIDFLTMSEIYGCSGETIKLIVGIDTPSNLWNQIEVEWLDFTCEWLFDSKYEVITKGNSTELTIPDVQKGEMSGFCLRVTNGFRNANHYFVMHLDDECN